MYGFDITGLGVLLVETDRLYVPGFDGFLILQKYENEMSTFPPETTGIGVYRSMDLDERYIIGYEVNGVEFILTSEGEITDGREVPTGKVIIIQSPVEREVAGERLKEIKYDAVYPAFGGYGETVIPETGGDGGKYVFM